MKITGIGLFVGENEVARFSLRGEDPTSRFIVRQVVGLDAMELTPTFYEFAPRYVGEALEYFDLSTKHYNFVQKARDVVMRLILNPNFALDEDYGTIRDEMYKVISSSRTGLVRLVFYSGGGTIAKLDGLVTKLEVGYFQQLPEIQLTVRCDYPMLTGVTPVRIEEGNPILSVLSPTNKLFTLTDNLSTAPHGLYLKAVANTSVASFTLQDKQTEPTWKFQVQFVSNLANGDEFYISTIRPGGFLFVLTGSGMVLLMDRIQPGSSWPLVFPGRNDFYFPESNSYDIEVIEFYPTYWGV